MKPLSPAEAADRLIPVQPGEALWRSCRQPRCAGELIRVAGRFICDRCGAQSAPEAA